MGKGKQDSKASDKGSGGKAGKGKEKEKEKDSKPKGAMSVNVRHILVCLPAHRLSLKQGEGSSGWSNPRLKVREAFQEGRGPCQVERRSQV